MDNRGRFSKYYVAAHGVAGEVEAAAAAGRSDLRALLICGSGQVLGAGMPGSARGTHRRLDLLADACGGERFQI